MSSPRSEIGGVGAVRGASTCGGLARLAFLTLLGGLGGGCGPSSSDAGPRPLDPERYVPAPEAPGSDSTPPGESAVALLPEVAVPGTRVRLRPPSGFVPTPEQPGFRHSEGAWIRVLELDVPFAELAATLTPEGLTERGLVLLGSDSLEDRSQPARLVRARPAEGRGEPLEEEWLFGTGNGRRSVLILASARSPELRAALRQALLSTRWNPEAAPAEEEEPFLLGYVDGMRVWQRMGGTVVYTEDGEPDSAHEGKAALVMGPSLIAVPVEDREEFARLRLQALPYEGMELGEPEAVEIDGLTGLRIQAEGRDPESGIQVVVEQTVLFDGQGYWLAVGTCGKDRAATFGPILRAMVQSFRRSP